jgi:hypothetical protein
MVSNLVLGVSFGAVERTTDLELFDVESAWFVFLHQAYYIHSSAVKTSTFAGVFVLDENRTVSETLRQKMLNCEVTTVLWTNTFTEL